MQAIETRYLGPTNFRGSRIKAICDAKTITVDYDHAAPNLESAHDVAARALILQLGWNDGRGRWIRGCTSKSRGYVYVLDTKSHSEELNLEFAPVSK